MPRLLHLVGTIDPAAGGPTEVIRMLVRHAPPGYETEVATLDHPAAPFLPDFGCPVHPLGRKPARWYNPALRRWLLANRQRFDGVFVHGLWEYTGLAARQALRGHVPYAVFPHGMLDPWFKRTYPAKHLKKWLYWIAAEYWNLRFAYRVLFTTPTEAKLATQTFRLHHWTPAVTAIGCEAPSPTSHTVAQPDTPALIEAFYRRWPAIRGQRFLLYLGRIAPKKGPDLLLRAFADQEVLRKDPALCLVMAGPADPDYRTSLEVQTFSFYTEGRIHWPGMLTGDAKLGALAACEAFVLPSHQENFGVAVAEALAAGKPVLISDQINIAPEIAADQAGLVEPDTLDGTRRLLDRWLSLTPDERAAMGEQARRTFAARYDMRVNAAHILRVFESSRESSSGAAR